MDKIVDASQNGPIFWPVVGKLNLGLGILYQLKLSSSGVLLIMDDFKFSDYSKLAKRRKKQ